VRVLRPLPGDDEQDVRELRNDATGGPQERIDALHGGEPAHVQDHAPVRVDLGEPFAGPHGIVDDPYLAGVRVVPLDQLLSEVAADGDHPGRGGDPALFPLEDMLPGVAQRPVVLGGMDGHDQRSAETVGEGGRPVGPEPIVDVDHIDPLHSRELRDPGVVAVGCVPERAVRRRTGPVRGRERGGSLSARSAGEPEGHALHRGERARERRQEGDPVAEAGELFAELVTVDPQPPRVARRPLPADHDDVEGSRRYEQPPAGDLPARTSDRHRALGELVQARAVERRGSLAASAGHSASLRAPPAPLAASPGRGRTRLGRRAGGLGIARSGGHGADLRRRGHLNTPEARTRTGRTAP
jgi:hypothetical protein